MYFVGCDLGSTTGKAVVLEPVEGGLRLASWALEPSGFSPDETASIVCRSALDAVGCAGEPDGLCLTGYGREHVTGGSHNVSEITCHGKGAHFLSPSVRTIIDVGGQDVKVIALGQRGNVVEFAMNDKCAAGTGKFFEAMARTLRCTVPELGALALESTAPVDISSTCSVFAESEVITHINKGVPRADIAGGIHESIARRLNAMVRRVGLTEGVALTGGCAKNDGLRHAVEEILEVEFLPLPCDPQINGALGAALAAYERYRAAHKDLDLPEPRLAAIADTPGGRVRC